MQMYNIIHALISSGEFVCVFVFIGGDVYPESLGKYVLHWPGYRYTIIAGSPGAHGLIDHRHTLYSALASTILFLFHLYKFSTKSF